MTDHATREAALRELATKKVAYRLPGIDALRPPRSMTYRSTSGAGLPMDIYYPPPPRRPRTPLALAPLAYPDPDGHVLAFGPLTSWARLMAASGMATVVYGAEAPERDVHAALRHLRANADTLDLDTKRLGLFAASGNATVALAAAMEDREVTCAALLCGCTMDLSGSTAIADMARQFGFVNACAGKSVADLPADVPLLFVRAGRDRFPGLNVALDTLVAGALARNLPMTLINHATGVHAFDLEEDTAMSRGIIQQVLDFLRRHLAADAER